MEKDSNAYGLSSYSIFIIVLTADKIVKLRQKCALTEVKLNYMRDCYIHNYVLCPVKMHFYRSLATVKIINCDCDNQPSSLSLYARCLNINTLQNMDWNQISTDCLIQNSIERASNVGVVNNQNSNQTTFILTYRSFVYDLQLVNGTLYVIVGQHGTFFSYI